MGLTALFSGVTSVSVILFLLGIIFLVAEMFHPGFGAFGVLGIACLIVDVIVTAQNLVQGLFFAGFILVVLLILLLMFLRLAAKGKVPKRLVLKDSTDRASGFSSSVELEGLVGKTGRTTTALRPAGCVTIDGNRYDVVSRGDFVEPDTEVVVVEVEGSRIVVGALAAKQTYVHK